MSSLDKDMKNLVKNFTFGEVRLSNKEKYFYKYLNNQISLLCKSLPAHIQNSAMLFMLNYSNIKIGEPLDFYKNFYKPAWTIIPAMAELKAASRELTEPEYITAISGQAMALFLHSLDDHLNDGELSPSHLLLLMRSQAWLLFKNAINECTVSKEESDLADLLINEYYEGMYPDKQPAGLDEYCGLFKKEISTWYITPMLAAIKTFGNPDSACGIRKAMEHFGIAWRLIDDIQDIEEDMACGRHTAVYHSLPEEAKKIWDAAAPNGAGGNNDAGIREEILRELSAGKTPEGLSARIIGELDTARKTAEELGMYRLGEQYRALGEPVKELLDAGCFNKF